MQADVWTSPEGVGKLGDELVGYDVEGADGEIGTVDHVSYAGTCVVVSTGRLFGKKHVIPASFVERIDTDSKTMFVHLAKEDVENSPEYDDRLGVDEECEAKTGGYYADVPAKRPSLR